MLLYYLILTALLTSFAEGNCGSDFPYNKTFDHISLNETYCYVSNCAVKLKESNLLLNITNDTGEWIIITNTTNLSHFLLTMPSTIPAAAVYWKINLALVSLSLSQQLPLSQSYPVL